MNRASLRWIAPAVVSVGVTFSLVAMAKLSKSGAAQAGFHASGPAGLGIDGTSSDVGIADDGTNVTILVGLKTVKTGIELRDEHTKKALEADKYDTAEFKVARADLKFPTSGESAGDAKGSMKIHGQSKDVTVHYKVKKDGDVMKVSGTAKINMTDFGIKPPSYMGVGVKPDVDVSVSFNVKD